MQVPDNLWAQWADPHFQQAGEEAPTAQESLCPKVAALLHKLHTDGLIHKSPSSPNALTFVKALRSVRSLLISRPSIMPAHSRRGRSSCPRSRASRELCTGGGGRVWGAKIDLSNCYWSVHLPSAMAGAVRVAVAGTTYALVRVPFGWHQAPGLVQHLMGALLSELPDTQVVFVQYLDDILFVGRDYLLTTQVARDTVAHLARTGFLVSPKSVVGATQYLSRGWMKQLSLRGS